MDGFDKKLKAHKMNKKLIIRYAVLGILFFLPVAFLLMLLPAKHNYNALDIVKENIDGAITSDYELKDHITVMAFFGKQPLENAIAASNLKELTYDKFKGFKKFQIVAFVSPEAKDDMAALKNEIESYEDLKYWHFVYLSDEETHNVFDSLNFDTDLDSNLATTHVVIVDKDLNQRGRIDDRTDGQKEKNAKTYGLNSYDCIEVAVIKNKMSEDMRVLFTEYREKRKGNFDSSTRRANDIKGNTNEQEN